MNSDLDMNIDNYELEDLLKLFNLEFNFSKEDLKQAKRVVLMTHPDKSKLPKEYFLFFSSAYKIVLSIYDFRHRNINTNTDSNSSNNQMSQLRAARVDEKDEEKELLLKQIKNKPNFNKLFNKLFEKNQMKFADVESGYGDWLKSNDDLDDDTEINKGKHKSVSSMDAYFNDKKKKVQSIVKHNDDISDIGENTYVNLTRDKPVHYSSSVFSKNLEYQDLQKAYIESVVPVTHDDYLNRKHFNSVDELTKYNASQNTTPPSIQEAQEHLKQMNNKEAQSDVQRAFKLARQDEMIRKSNMGWMSNFKQLL